MAVGLYLIFALANLGLLPLGVWLLEHFQCLEIFLLLVIVGAIAYDNLMISVGHLIGEGKTLLWLSQPRFFLHVTLTPLTIMAALCQSYRAGMSWAHSSLLLGIAWSSILALIVTDLILYYRDFKPVPVTYQGTLRYTNASAMTPPIPAIITVILICIIGALMWYQAGWPWLCISGVIMLLGNAVPPRLVGPALGSGVEALLMIGFWVTELHVQDAVPIL